MLTRAIVVQELLLVVSWSMCSLGQGKAPATVPPGVQEFPVTLEQGLESGKTPIGTKVQAKLAVATLVNRVVIPKDAIFTGVVIESVAKSAKGPCRLAIRMDSVQWKEGSASIKAYLTALYYPKTTTPGPSLQYGPQEPPSRTWNGAGQYPSADSRVYQPFPSADSDKNAGAVPDTPSSTTSNSPAWIKNVTLAATDDGGIALVSQHANLKLDKSTTYVLAASGLPGK
jgi:hypothetical protein